MLRPEFAVRRTGERYHRAEVAERADRLLATIDGAPTGLTVTMLRNAEFGRPLFGAGYAADQVDDFLGSAEAWLPKDPATRHAGGWPNDPAARQPAHHVTGASVGHGPPRPQFTVVRLREGYDVAEVDEFVDRVMATMTGRPISQPVTTRDIRNVQFSPVRVREGYDVQEVDSWLDTIETWLRDH